MNLNDVCLSLAAAAGSYSSSQSPVTSFALFRSVLISNGVFLKSILEHFPVRGRDESRTLGAVGVAIQMSLGIEGLQDAVLL